MFLKIMIVMVIAACVAPFFINGPDNKPLMTIEQFLPEFDLDADGSSTTIYKWQDADGVWQFTNEPVEGEHVQVVELSNEINTVKSFAPGSAHKQVQRSAAPQPDGVSRIPGGLSVSPDKVDEMIETVTNLQETLDQRSEDIEQSILQN
jgi:hypothetical protein